jgi:hypothetical protein
MGYGIPLAAVNRQGIAIERLQALRTNQRVLGFLLAAAETDRREDEVAEGAEKTQDDRR